MDKGVLLIVGFLCLMVTLVECRPSQEIPSADKINVEDTDDEFIIKKPESKDPTYNEFLDELYQHDKSKVPSSKTKRFAGEMDGNEKLTVDSPKEFDIPAKPEAHKDENYDQFLSHLYRHDELKRSRRTIATLRV